jgi:polysaccharide deacetylase family protein (PEP-CTERM system associated)
MNITNVLTVDVEDYFHVEAFADCIPKAQWDLCSPRVERNVDRILVMLDRYDVKATFFVLGWVAAKFPLLVRRIAAADHEIGCHGFSHDHLHRLSPDGFRADVRDARNRLMDLTQQPVVCYRAPSFSVTSRTMWAFDILAEEGFVFDSSVFPVRHDVYGIPAAARFPQWYRTGSGNAIFEFPPSTVRYWNNNWGVAGGGYLRFFPYAFTRWALQQINQEEHQPAMVYLHPWEIDPEQPKVSGRWRSRLRHYTNLGTTAIKLERLLQEFRFTSFSEACQHLECFQSRRLHPWQSFTPPASLTRPVACEGVGAVGH